MLEINPKELLHKSDKEIAKEAKRLKLTPQDVI
jgi:hypothetical protein